MNSYTYTHIWVEGLSNRQLCNKMLKALKDLQGLDQGTIRNPFELASMILDNNGDRSLISILNEDGEVKYYDGCLCIECDGQTLYVDYTGRGLEAFGLEDAKRLANDNING